MVKSRKDRFGRLLCSPYPIDEKFKAFHFHVINLADGNDMDQIAAAYEHDGPVYMRFGRLAVPIINDNPDYKFEIGKGVTLREGKDVAIIATGLCVSESLAAAKECGKVVTVEEHSVIGGLGSAVCEALSHKAPTPVKTIGVQDCFGESGPAVALLE